MFDCINGILPTPILEFFITNATIHAHHTRQRNVPHVTQTFGTISERAVTHKGPQTLTEIPHTIRLHQNKNIFSRLLKKRLYHQVQLNVLLRVGWGIAPMGGAKRAPLILANIELCGSIWRSNDSLQHTKDLSTDEDVLI